MRTAAYLQKGVNPLPVPIDDMPFSESKMLDLVVSEQSRYEFEMMEKLEKDRKRNVTPNTSAPRPLIRRNMRQ